MTNDPWIDLTTELATKLLIRWLKQKNHGKLASYGYDIYLPSLAINDLRITYKISNTESDIFRKHSALFYNAAWELCRRGILRPGISIYEAQATADGASGNGYSITPFGHQWLQEADHHDFVPTEPEAFGKIIARYKDLFGPGFHQRAQEAIRCYGAHAYLACCVMCGAAAESIMLNLAIKKSKDEPKILKEYRTAHGRLKIENILLNNKKEPIRKNFSNINNLLKYWRDESAHGTVSKIAEEDAFIMLSKLLEICKLCENNHDILTS